MIKHVAFDFDGTLDGGDSPQFDYEFSGGFYSVSRIEDFSISVRCNFKHDSVSFRFYTVNIIISSCNIFKRLKLYYCAKITGYLSKVSFENLYNKAFRAIL